MRLQIANPSEHRPLFSLPWHLRLERWPDEYELVDPGGLHRHVVRFYEHGDITYVLKELPEALAYREYRLLRALIEAGIPAGQSLGVVSDRGGEDPGEAVLITRHLDFALTYRVLLSGRGLRIPYLGERLLDSLVGLLARLHLNGFFWGDCSLSNTLFRRDAGALVAFVIDVETGELHPSLTDGQRRTDIAIAVENIAGGLIDLQLGGYLAEGIDPLETVAEVESRYHALWSELTAEELFRTDELYRIDERLRRLHELGFDVGELEFTSGNDDRERVRLVPASSRSATSPLVWHSSRVCTPGRTRRAGCSTTSGGSGSSSKGATASASPRTSSPPGGSTRSTNRSSPRSRGSWPGAWSRPSSSTSCSSTAGSCPSRPARTSVSTAPGARTSTTSCATHPTSTS